MFELLFAILLGLAAPTQNTTVPQNGTTVTTNNPTSGEETPPGDDTGGEIGHIPPKNP